MAFFNKNPFLRLVFVVEGKDNISEFTLRMIAKSLERYNYHTQVTSMPLTIQNAHNFFCEFYPDVVILNDFIIDPNILGALIVDHPLCKFFVRDIHSNIMDPEMGDLFNIIIRYIKAGASVLTTSKAVFQFRHILPVYGIERYIIKWAPDIIMPQPDFRIPNFFDRERDPFHIGLYVDDIGVSGNIVIPFLGATYFACNNRQKTVVHLLAEHMVSSDGHMKSIKDLPDHFPLISLRVYDNLKFDNFLSIIPKMNVVAHLTLTNTESAFCGLGIRSNVPVLRSKQAPTFIKKIGLVEHESVESIARGLNQIYKETPFKKSKRLFNQIKWLCEYNHTALDKWKEFLPTLKG